MDFKVFAALSAVIGFVFYWSGFKLAALSLKPVLNSTFNEAIGPHMLRLQCIGGAIITVLCSVGWVQEKGRYVDGQWATGWLSGPANFDAWFAYIANTAFTAGLVLAIQILLIFFWSFAAIVISSKLKLLVAACDKSGN